MFVTQAGALLSPSHMALGSTNREANMAAGEVLFLERHCRSCISSASHSLRGTQNNHEVLFLSASEERRQPRSSVFEPASSAHTMEAQTNHRKPQQYLRTASTAKQPSIGPEQSSKVHTAVRSCRPEWDNASKQAWKSKSRVAECHARVFTFLFFLFIRAKRVSNCYFEVHPRKKKLTVCVCVDVRLILVLVWNKLSWF